MEPSMSAFALEADSPVSFGQTFAMLRKLQPVYYDEARKAWVLLRHRDILFTLRNPELFSNKVYARGSLGETPSAMDGVDHARHRRLFSRVFTPAAVRKYEESVILPAAQRVVERVVAQPACDLVSEFCFPLPIEVISPLLGMAPEYVDPCRAWVTAMVHWNVFPDDPEFVQKGRDAQRQMAAHVRPIVEREIGHPGPNMLGEIIAAYQQEGILDVEQMVHFAVGLVMGGFETTAWALACALGAFLLHPQSMRRVQEDPTLLMPAVEESMRWTPSFIGVLRMATRDVTLSGVTIPQGSPVLLCIGAAHYDEEVYPSPEVFDIDRRPEHLLFAAGPHYCLGASLARMEVRAGLSLLLQRLSGLRLDPAHKLRFAIGARGSAMMGPTALHVLHDAEQLARAA